METLSRISSGIGNHLYADECTTAIERISYARVLVEMDITRPLPNTVQVQDPNGKIFDQAVLYDWKPIPKPPAKPVPNEPKATKETDQGARSRNVQAHQTGPHKVVVNVTPPPSGVDWQSMTQKTTARGNMFPSTDTAYGSVSDTIEKSNMNNVASTSQSEMTQLSSAVIELEPKPPNADNYNSNEQGRIWLLWNPTRVSVRVIQSHEQFIHSLVVIGNTQFLLTAIHGLHTIITRRTLWAALERIHTGVQDSGILMGNYNAITEIDNMLNGAEVQDCEVRNFRQFIQDTSLHQLNTAGREFTWSNGTVYSRINRALVNSTWMLNMSTTSVTALEPLFSHHSPLCLSIVEQRRDPHRPFKFYNYMVEHQGFKQAVSKCWSRHIHYPSLKQVWLKLMHVKYGMKKLRKTEFQGIVEKIDITRQKLTIIQNLIAYGHHQEPVPEEKLLRSEFEKWTTIEESIWRQKSRVHWLKLVTQTQGSSLQV
ncbi:uncharacterized protein LOC132066402 [Lycium ferocissimum]|uniref:uncharacterized protein LOC132066402 n=1 Tax=Lycium ferocissimum TaxID=112874 RepID=UPI0028165658|nr:uncharacterized protein LOC132066402 [Lycium ferocissimum]